MATDGIGYGAWEPHNDYAGEPMKPGEFRDPPTAPDPLREDEVEAVARALAKATNVEVTWPHFMDKARAAILRLDQVREGRGK